jgi:hypothetical protein
VRTSIAWTALLLTGCQQPEFPEGNWSAFSSTKRQEAIRQIAESCGLESDQFEIRRGNRIRVTTRRYDPNDNVSCAVFALQTLRGLQFDFYDDKNNLIESY